MIEHKIQKALGCEGCRFYRFETLEELVDKAMDNHIDIAYIELEGKYGFTQELASSIKNSLANVVHTVVLTKNENERMDLLKIGVSESIVKPFFGSEIKKSFGRITARSNVLKYADTTRLINAMIDFFDCKELSFRMESIAQLACDHFGISGKTEAKIRKCAKYLSIAIEKKSLEKTISFLESIGRSSDIAEAIVSGLEADKASAIVSSIINIERLSVGREPCVDPKTIPADIADYISLLYEQNPLVVDALEEVGIAVEIIDRCVLCSDKESRAAFVDKIRALLYHELAYHNGAKIEIDNKNGECVIKIEPLDKRVFKRCLTFAGIDIKVETSPFVQIKQEKGYFLFTVIEEIKNTSEVGLVPKKETISAPDYVSEHALTRDEEEVLGMLEYEMLDICDYLHDSKNKVRFIKSLFALVFKYASVINYHLEFQSITDALYALESTVEKQLDESIDDDRGALMALVVESIVTNLVRWRRSIFVDQSVDDIHYLDHSIIADCNQLMMSFFAENCAYVQDIDNDMEFF